jgi:hypothetical protein
LKLSSAPFSFPAKANGKVLRAVSDTPRARASTRNAAPTATTAAPPVAMTTGTAARAATRAAVTARMTVSGWKRSESHPPSSVPAESAQPARATTTAAEANDPPEVSTAKGRVTWTALLAACWRKVPPM